MGRGVGVMMRGVNDGAAVGASATLARVGIPVSVGSTASTSVAAKVMSAPMAITPRMPRLHIPIASHVRGERMGRFYYRV